MGRRVGLLGLLLVLALGSGAVAQSPSPEPPPWFGGRVEMPEYGFALTLPGGWTVQEATPEGERTTIVEEALLEGQSMVLAAERLGKSGACLVYVDDPSMRDFPVLLSLAADLTVRGLGQDKHFDEVEPVRVDLAAGPAWRIDYANDAASSSMYLLRGRDRQFAMDCAAADPPQDRWFSIADTFEFLPDPVTGSVPSSPVLGSGRIELPEECFAITVPDDWTVEEVTPEADAWLFDSLEPADRALHTTVLWADQPDSDGYCIIVDFTGFAEEPPPWSSIDEATGWFFDGLANDPDLVGPQSDIEHLPVGRAGHITAKDHDGWSYGAYYFTDGDAWFYLRCRSPNPPADDWLHIAETFEFLPAEE